MKRLVLVIIIIALLPIGCTVPYYYQLFELKSIDFSSKEHNLKYENEDVIVSYNFWSNNGNSQLLIFNKTEHDIYVDLSGTHLVVNKIATTYYQGRSQTTSNSTSNTFGGGTSSSISNILGNTNSTNMWGTNYYSTNQTEIVNKNEITIPQQKVILIPSKAAKYIPGFEIIEDVFRSCDIFRYPNKNDINSASFSEETSPLNIRIIINYRLNDEDMTNRIENEFWVEKITNYAYNDFIKNIKEEFCEEKTSYSIIKHYLYNQPNRFYIQYKSSSNPGLRH